MANLLIKNGATTPADWYVSGTGAGSNGDPFIQTVNIRSINSAVRVAKSITRPSNTTAYSAGQALGASTSVFTQLNFASLSRLAGATVELSCPTLFKGSNQGSANPTIRLMLYREPLNSANDTYLDAAAPILSDAVAKSFIGSILFNASDWQNTNSTSGASGNAVCNGIFEVNGPVRFSVKTGISDIYAVPIFLAAYTPVSADEFEFAVVADQR